MKERRQICALRLPSAVRLFWALRLPCTLLLLCWLLAPLCLYTPTLQACELPHPATQTHSSFIPGKGLKVVSGDGRFALATRLRAQFLYSVMEGQSAPTHLFELRRARAVFNGHGFGTDKRFKIELAFSPRDLGYEPGQGIAHVPLLSWFVDLGDSRDLRVKAGQYKVPFSRQRVVSSGNLQLVDRSIANAEFNLDRDTGVEIHSEDLGGLDLLDYHLGVFMNRGRNLQAPTNVSPMVLARLELTPFGRFRDYSEADLKRMNKPKLALGVAAGWLQGAVKDRGILGAAYPEGVTGDTLALTADVVFKFRGLSILGEFFYRDVTLQGVPAGDPNNPDAAVAPPAARDGTGWVLQAGYLLPQRLLEIAARVGQVTPADASSSLPGRGEVGGGVSWYPGGHPWKIQADVFHLWDEGRFDEGELRFRLQLQAGL